MTPTLDRVLRRSPTRVAAALGVLAADRGVSLDEAVQLVADAAARRGVTLDTIADEVLRIGTLS